VAVRSPAGQEVVLLLASLLLGFGVLPADVVDREDWGRLAGFFSVISTREHTDEHNHRHDWQRPGGGRDVEG
jgi:hypothetical protein